MGAVGGDRMPDEIIKFAESGWELLAIEISSTVPKEDANNVFRIVLSKFIDDWDKLVLHGPALGSAELQYEIVIQLIQNPKWAIHRVLTVAQVNWRGFQLSVVLTQSCFKNCWG